VAEIADVELGRRPKRNRKKPALTQLCELSSLRRAWEGIGKNPLSFGIDNVSIEAFRNNLESELARIRTELLSKTYKFQKLRGVAIPKAGTDNIRPIQVPAVRDRVVAKAIAVASIAMWRSVSEVFGVSVESRGATGKGERPLARSERCSTYG
jgi:retron-type reverse transcriptase